MGTFAIDPDRLRAGDRRALARSITLVESELPSHQLEAEALLEALMPSTGGSLRIGITGTPGVGKSTFIEAFGSLLVDSGLRIAVLAVDPSSPRGGGSILGDKTRMETLARNENAFIRPSPSGESIGGVAHKTRECMLLCEAAGYDVVIIETVGMGQSGADVADMVDFFLVLAQPRTGDALQGIKRGLIELADALIVNKADGDMASDAGQTCRHYEAAFELMTSDGFWKPRVLSCSALERVNIDAVWFMIREYFDEARSCGAIEDRRAWQNLQWMRRLTLELLERKLRRDARLAQELSALERSVRGGEISPLAAARLISRLP